MLDSAVVIGALGAGRRCSCAVLVAEGEPTAVDAGRWTPRSGARVGAARNVAAARRRLAHDIERAGWRETPERVAVAAAAVSLCVGILGAALSPAVAIFGFLGGCITCAVVLKAAEETED